MIGMMALSELAQQLGGELIGNDSVFNQLSTDTRTLARGDAYLALSGERFDGNAFVSEAIEKGASGAIVSQELDHEIPMLRVADTHLALGEIAKLNRQRSSATVIALTGSQGKTTVKEMINSILSNRAATLVTHANLNNTIGVSLTLLQLNDEHRFAVVEMGADCAGEISFSVDKTQPDIALITNANAAHIDGFGSLQGIVEGKGEIIEGLHESGTLILNADDPNVEQWIARAASKNIVLFSPGSSETAVSYSATNCRLDSQGRLSFTLLSPTGRQDITLKLLGKHNVANAVAAASAAMQAGATLDDVHAGLKLLKPVAGRLNPLTGTNGCCVIDDTYNASPTSFIAAIDVLVTYPTKTVLIAGDMKELGAEIAAAHSAVGEYASRAGVNEFWAVGECSLLAVQAFGYKARHFSDKAELVAACKEIANENTVFLVKGSRGSQMETVVSSLMTSEGG